MFLYLVPSSYPKVNTAFSYERWDVCGGQEDKGEW